MRRVSEILRLKALGLNQTEISRSVNVTRATVRDYVRKAAARNITLESISSLSEEELREIFGKGRSGRKIECPEPDCFYIHRELSRKGVTLQVLWEEYLREHPNGCSYSRYCTHYREWKKSQKLSLRREHRAGEKVFVDYCGPTVTISPAGEASFEASIFVSCLGASNLIYAEATCGEDSSSWLGSHVRMFDYYGGTPESVVPDNLKSGVSRACYYEPELNRSYRELAEHYSVAVIPTRVRKPKDKAKVETAVQIVERQILARLRNRRFESLGELNSAIAQLLEAVNEREMKDYGASRRELFESIEKESLNPLPSTRFKATVWKIAKVNIDYHVEVERRYYSVPYQLRGEEVEVQITEKSLSIFHNNKQVSVHPRVPLQGRQSTYKEHMPQEHRYLEEWSPSRFLDWAAKIGPETKRQVDALLNARAYPEQSYRACLGLLRLAKKYGHERLEAASARANHFGIVSYRSIDSMLKTGQEKLPLSEHSQGHATSHQNVRGSGYYH